MASKFYVLVFATKEDRTAGEQAYEFDCETLDEAYASAHEETEKSYAASIYERSGNTAPSVRVATVIRPQVAA